MSRVQAAMLVSIVLSIAVMMLGLYTYIGKGPLAESVDFEQWMERSGARQLADDDPALKKYESKAQLAMGAARLRTERRSRVLMSCAGCLLLAGLVGGGWANRRAEARLTAAASPPPAGPSQS